MKPDKAFTARKLLIAILFRFAWTSKSKQSVFTNPPNLNLSTPIAQDGSKKTSIQIFTQPTKSFADNFDGSISASVPPHLFNLRQYILNHIHASDTDPGSSFSLRQIPTDYMLTLYNHQSGLATKKSDPISAKADQALKKSDIVRSFEAVESFQTARTWIIIFDTSAILYHERIRMAELRIGNRTDVNTIELWDERRKINGKQASLVKRKIGNVRLARKPTSIINKADSCWTIDVTRVLRRWYNVNERDEQSVNAIKSRSPVEKRDSKPRKIRRKQRSLPQASAMLFVYSTNKNIELFDVATARRDRKRRASKRNKKNRRISVKRKRRRRKNRKRNRTERLPVRKKPRHNEVEMIFLPSRQGVFFSNELEPPVFSKEKSKKDEIDEWMREQGLVIVVEDVVDEIEEKVPNESNNLNKKDVTTPLVSTTISTTKKSIQPEKKLVKQTHCRRVPYTIDFEKIGWENWIVHPLQYNAYRCVGECNGSRLVTRHATNHAYIQGGLSRNPPKQGMPEPCCAPSKLLPMDVLFYEDGLVKHRVHEEMIVAECECF